MFNRSPLPRSRTAVSGPLTLLLFGGLLCANAQWAFAQNESGAPPADSAPAASTAPTLAPMPSSGRGGTSFTPLGGSANFRLDVDDVIAVQVANHPEMSSPGSPVADSGRVALPVVGPLYVKGKTLAEAQKIIAKAFSRELRNPKVTVTLARARPRQVMMLGVVGTTGPVDMGPGWRVSEALAAAGNLTADPEWVRATLVRGKNPPMPLKIRDILTSPASSANVRLAPNDVLNFVAVPPMRVTVTGEVAKPGVLGLRGRPRVLDAVLAVGGPKFGADKTRLTLMRDGKTTSLNLPVIVQGTSLDENILLRENDLLSFEAIEMNVSVISLDNLVKKTGNFPLKGSATVLRALEESGGLAVPPDKIVVTVRRGEQTIPVDLIKAVANPADDLALENNDIVFVNWPEGPRVRLIGGVTNPGPYSFKSGTTVLDAIVQAGGLAGKPSEVEVDVLRTLPDGRQINLSVDATKLFELRDLGQNVRLQDNDLIFVNPANRLQTVFVSGDVTTQGAYEIMEGEGVTELLLRAGGPLPTAALSRVSLTRRDGTTQVIDFSAALTGQKPKIDVPLTTGDVVNVPRNVNQVLVMNAVTKPGYVAVPENGRLTLSDALLAAGGPTGSARTRQIAVVRRTPTGAERKVVSLDDVQKGNTSALELTLAPGDVVYVPEGNVTPSTWQKLTGALGTVGLFRGLF